MAPPNPAALRPPLLLTPPDTRREDSCGNCGSRQGGCHWRQHLPVLQEKLSDPGPCCLASRRTGHLLQLSRQSGGILDTHRSASSLCSTDSQTPKRLTIHLADLCKAEARHTYILLLQNIIRVGANTIHIHSAFKNQSFHHNALLLKVSSSSRTQPLR